MTREFLKGLNLTQEAIDSIMTEYGKNIEKYKGLEEENKALKTQAEANANSIKQLEEKAKGNDALTAQIEELKTANARAKKDYETNISTLKINNAVDQFLTEKKAKNKTAVKSLIDMEKVTLNDKGEVTGLNEQWDTIFNGNEYMFEGNNPNFGGENKPGTGSAEPFAGFADIR